MKSHAFVRSNTGKILRFDTDSAKSNRDSKKVIGKNFASFFFSWKSIIKKDSG
jgi:hypothetical protein